MHNTDSDSQYPAYGDEIPDSTVVEVPPESFWLSKDSEFDWFDRNVLFERNESTKGYTNSANLNPNVNPSHSNSSSQRYSVNLKSKAAIIGLPKTQKPNYIDSKRRHCKPVNVRLFPKRSNSIGKTPATVLVTEPSSPKVSCIGRVRSKRCRSRRKTAGPVIEPVRSASQRSGRAGSSRVHKSGFISRITSLFRSEGHRKRKDGKPVEKENKPVEKCGSRRMYVTVKPVCSEPGTPTEPLGLGGMVRFASGRRSESWVVSDGDDTDVDGRHSLDLGRRGVWVS
ncbi:uncharacterized protein [Rutidosis leptorrhynchoides]|uniref:uncharacterized protein n=1 Tax=Rutidosis leptorrhynchoides TaxID=125765 RepID=UPI003A98E49F